VPFRRPVVVLECLEHRSNESAEQGDDVPCESGPASLAERFDEGLRKEHVKAARRREKRQYTHRNFGWSQ
jgi:hypothetical protein